MTIAFEPMREEHVPPLTAIFNHYVEHSTSLFVTQPIGGDEMRAMLFFEDPRHAAFAVLADGTLAGYVSLHSHRPRAAYWDTADITIFLAPAYTGRGIGPQAIEFIEAYAREQGFHALLASIAGGNTASVRLFEKLGYARAGHLKEIGYKHDQWLDVFWYEKIL